MKLLFLDLDGTVRVKRGAKPGIVQSGFITSPSDQEIIEGAQRAIVHYRFEGWSIIGCTNQAGVEAGYKSLDDCFDEQLYTLRLVKELDHILFCPDYEGRKLGEVNRDESRKLNALYYRPYGFRCFRKPDPGMIDWTIANHKPDDPITEMLFVGDRPEDEQAAAAADVRFVWAADWWM
jgi:D-glycero-D-manno-heptose 1,7-bisphosphate phosphatase